MKILLICTYLFIAFCLFVSCTRRAWKNESFKGFIEETFIGVLFSVNWFLISLFCVVTSGIGKLIRFFKPQKEG